MNVSIDVSGIPTDPMVDNLVAQLNRSINDARTDQQPSSFLSRFGSMTRQLRSTDLGSAGAEIQTIQLSLDRGTAAAPNDESYRLEVSDQGGVKVTAPRTAGLFYGAQTLKQLMAFGKTGLPCVTIEDAPRFPWRGVMLDSSRHFFPADNVKSMLQTMATFKLNRFHWHLTDDQGWRLPIEGYPDLTGNGANGVTKGSYSEKDINEVVKCAREHNIVVVPEVDVPGHVQAVIASYPELGNNDIRGWKKPTGPSHEWGVHDYTLAPTKKVEAFLGNVFDSVHNLFPGDYVHIGGDEVKTGEWGRSKQAAFSAMQLGERTSRLQKSFNHNVSSLLESRARRPIAWDESDHIGGLPADAIIMGWRNVNEVKLAARKGHDAINADAEHYYLDRYQGDQSTEPKAICCYSPLATVYNNDPMPTGLTEDQQKHILGGQVQLWSEYLPTWKHVEYMFLPRGIAVAERFWTRSIHGYDEFVRRLGPRLGDLEATGVNYRPLDV